MVLHCHAWRRIVLRMGTEGETFSLETLTASVEVAKPPSVPTQRRTGVRGRAAFSTECAHGGTPDLPCPKFAHLPGNGRGGKQPNIFRTIVGVFLVVVKPLFYLSLVYVAYLLLSGYVTGLSFGNFVPGSNVGVPADDRRSSNGSLPAHSICDSGIPTVCDARTSHSVLT